MSSPRTLVAPLVSLALLALPAAAQNRPMELTWLRNAGAKYTGTSVNQKAGHVVAAAGRVNNDDYPDLLIGAPEIGLDPFSDPPGQVYVFFGDNGPQSGAAVSAADATIVGEDFGWQTGFAAAGVGDINGDGFDDIVVGAPRAKLFTLSGVGRAYLLWGGPTLTGTINLASLTLAEGVVINGAEFSDLFGIGAAGAGDVDADGTPDILIGASGEGSGEGATARGATYLVYGSGTLPAVLDIEAPVGTTVTKFVGVAASNETGKSLAGLGDVDADGFDDVLIAAEKAPSGSNVNGAAYLVWGSDMLPTLPATVPLATLGAQGVTFSGTSTVDNFGRSVCSAGDFDADGVPDMAMGAPSVNITGLNAEGRAYLVYGDASLAGSITASSIGGSVPGVLFNGINDPSDPGAKKGEQTGESVAGGGDANGDGYDDLLIGAGTANYGGVVNCGAVFLVYGSASLSGTQALGSLGKLGVVLEGVAAQDTVGLASGAGAAAAFVGDFDDDGFADMLVGAERHDAAGADAGAAWLVRGTPHMIQAVGPVLDGGTLSLRIHAVPGGAALTFASLAALPLPMPTKFGPWWLISQLDLFLIPVVPANGEVSLLGLPMPAAGSGLLGATIYMQTLGKLPGPATGRDMTYLLAFTIE